MKNVPVIYEKYICYVYKTKMVKLNKELTLGVLLIVIVVMILKPNLLGFLYNNILGKIIFVAAIVFAGVYPKPMLDRIEPSVKALIEHVEASK